MAECVVGKENQRPDFDPEGCAVADYVQERLGEGYEVIFNRYFTTYNSIIRKGLQICAIRKKDDMKYAFRFGTSRDPLNQADIENCAQVIKKAFADYDDGKQ